MFRNMRHSTSRSEDASDRTTRRTLMPRRYVWALALGIFLSALTYTGTAKAAVTAGFTISYEGKTYTEDKGNGFRPDPCTRPCTITVTSTATDPSSQDGQPAQITWRVNGQILTEVGTSWTKTFTSSITISQSVVGYDRSINFAGQDITIPDPNDASQPFVFGGPSTLRNGSTVTLWSGRPQLKPSYSAGDRNKYNGYLPFQSLGKDPAKQGLYKYQVTVLVPAVAEGSVVLNMTTLTPPSLHQDFNWRLLTVLPGLYGFRTSLGVTRAGRTLTLRGSALGRAVYSYRCQGTVVVSIRKNGTYRTWKRLRGARLCKSTTAAAVTLRQHLKLRVPTGKLRLTFTPKVTPASLPSSTTSGFSRTVTKFITVR